MYVDDHSFKINKHRRRGIKFFDNRDIAVTYTKSKSGNLL